MKLQQEKKLFVVGIVIFTDNFQQLEEFFLNLPDEINAAFIILLHTQSPSFIIRLTQFLEEKTPSKVYTIENETVIISNAFYIMAIVEGKYLQLENCILHLLDNPPESDTPINSFFKSLAQEWGRQAIAILISGNQNDGLEGLRAIHRANRISLAQSSETGQFTSVSTNTISSELLEEILSPRELAQFVYQIVESGRNPLSSPENQEGELSLIIPEELQEILGILYRTQDIDFSYYKISTLSRRIIHRCTLSRYGKLENYIHYLKNSSEEQKILCQDLLIGATSFFRDPPAWEYLKTEIIPEIVNRIQQEETQLRIWVSACATGEEAYSMAILVNEAMRQTGKSLNVKIFATDIDSNALETAARGIYPENIVDHLPQEYLERYFNNELGSYQIRRSLREMLIFAPHDLTKNPGFSQMHLVSCRNVLIYMQPELQQRVLRLLHFSLSSQGILFLGNTESVGELSEEFVTLNSRWNIYRKRRDVQLSLTHLTQKPVVLPTIDPSKQTKINRSRFDQMLVEVFRLGFGERKVTCLLVNLDNRLLNVFYNDAELLQIPVGEANLEVTEIILPELKLPMGTALHRAKRDKQTVLYTGIKLYHNDREESITLRVGYNINNPSLEEYLIIFLEVETPPIMAVSNLQNQVYEVVPEVAQQIAELEYELQQTRENLQAAVEELETINEEQQATNEELLASNEELQSTNEELQSANEELFTINSQYQAKIEELTHLSEDIDNLLHSIDIGVIFLDKNLRIRRFTPATSQAINIRGTDINRPLYHFTHNLDCRDFIEILQQALKTQQPIEREVILSTTGEILLLRVNPYIREDNINDGIVVTLVNINELQETKAQLAHTNNFLETLYEFSPTGLFLLDEELRFLRINSTFARINRLNVLESIGKTFSELLPNLTDRLNPIFSQILATGEIVRNIEINIPYTVASEIEGWWLANFYPVELKNSQMGIAGVITDITQLKRIQEELLHSQNLAETASQAKSEFIRRMSHELRTPLNVILGFTQVLSYGDNLNNEQREHLNMMTKNGHYLLELIEEVLDLSRIEANRMQLQPTFFEIHSLINNLREMFEIVAQSKSLQLMFEIDPEVPQYIYADQRKLRQVLINLISNAIKFTDLGHVKLKVGVVQISETEDDNTEEIFPSTTATLSFEISDTGKGISEQDLEKIFDSFVQGEAGKESQTGTGLGLTISKRFVQLMGGDIQINSELNLGTTANFSIIVNSMSNIAPVNLSAEQHIVGLAPDQPEYCILVVEDREDNRQLVVIILEELGFRVLEAVNGEEAIQKWEEHQPQLIFMDLQMPLMNGFEAIEQIKSTPEGQATPIIALSASARTLNEEQQSFLEANCADILSKPLVEDVLLNSIAECLDVKYIYSFCDLPSTPTDSTLPISSLSPETLNFMGKDFCSQLRIAAITCNSQEVISLLEQIPESQQQIKETLLKLANDYRFDIIAELGEEA
ncbi:CheR family methyltransferase [Dapis sp. BLCC M229]|uniref:CheR family methyltransferase n=1 Tax=Dapis sp. BLCC M229 TaxID=3400188 RepID=UPI003CFA4433